MATKENRSLEKTVRLILLMELQDQKKLDGLSLQEISKIFGGNLTKSTISRNLADAGRLRSSLILARNELQLPKPQKK